MNSKMICALTQCVRFLPILALSVLVSACAPAESDEKTVLMIGDSMFAWNRMSGSGVGYNLAAALDTGVEDRSVTGAHINVTGPDEQNPKRSIVAQYTPGNWDWVVINGGANDLLFECGCGRCTRTMNNLLSADLKSGAIADLVTRIRADGAKVMLVGYHAGQSGGHYFSGCRGEVSLLVKRELELAKKMDGVYMVRARKALDSDNPAHFYFDRVHPSKIGSKRIADLIAREIKRIDKRR